MDKNQKVFFDLLRTGLWGTSVNFNPNETLYKDVDWSEVYRLASKQSVLGLIAAGIDYMPQEVRPPQKIMLQIIGDALQIERQNKTMNEFLARLIDKLRNAGVYTLLLKGQGIALCYEKPLWRSCGDVDLFLSEENYTKAKNVLRPLAIVVDEEYFFTKHLGMTIKEWVVELHGTLRCKLSARIDRTLDEIQNDTFYQGCVRSRMIEGSQVFMLSPENDAVYVFTHFLNHFYKEGVGVRQICDWCRLLWTYRDSLNRGMLEKRIRQMGVMSEWKAFGAYAIEYIGMPANAMPLVNEEDNQIEKLKRKAERINEFVLLTGNFGRNRDMSHFEKYPFFVRKCVSAGRRIKDVINHASIFPMDSLLFSFTIIKNGVVSAVRGEG